MAVAYVTSSLTKDDGNVGSTTISFTVSGTDTVLRVGVAIDVNAGAQLVSSVTYNSVAMTELVQSTTDSSCRTGVWHLTAPDAGTHDLVVTYDTTVTRDRRIIIALYQGVDQTTPADAITTEVDATNNVSAVSLTYTNGAAGDLTVDFVAIRNTTGTIAADGGQTSRHADAEVNMMVGWSEKAGGSSVTMSWTITGNNGANRQHAFSLNPAGGAPSIIKQAAHHYKTLMGA